MRIISAVLVVFIHVNAHYMDVSDSSITGIIIVQNWINVITRMSVPLFVMLSGAFNLRDCKEGKSTVDFYKNAFYKMVIPFLEVYVFWGIWYTIKHVLNGASLRQIIIPWIKCTYGNLWFMPMIICLYLLAPGIVFIKKHISKKTFNNISYIIIIWSLISQGTSEYILPYSLGVVSAYTGYFMIGSVLYESDKKKSIVFPCFLIMLLSIITVYFRVGTSQAYAIDPYKAFFSPTIVIMSLMCFEVFKNLHINKNRYIVWISSKTLYIYLIHTIVIYVLFPLANRIVGNVLLRTLMVSISGAIFSLLISVIWEQVRKTINDRFNIEKTIYKI